MELIKLWEADLNKAYELQNTFRSNENGFVNSAYGYTFTEFLKYAKECERYAFGVDLPEGFVPATIFILENEKNEYVGIFNLRHSLTESLKEGAGHIGYGISPNYRKRGYAAKGLALVLQEAKRIGINEALLSVDKTNVASIKTQEANGAEIYREDDRKYYSKISLF
ncbi:MULTISPECIES: GNAT family N-acetyltransferase [unclassified Enterococcus]|uniref:GNAT family N-acetyltransferase n=1 Tax=unclassified Enterococcus TaxID=2608891 RepID=UPI0013E9E73B|nr:MULTISPECIES: GNAT family N-acetyltransferase [unclassified Enterococcus]